MNSHHTFAKAAVTNMTRQDAISFGKDHIRVNSVHPGTILTPLVKNSVQKQKVV